MGGREAGRVGPRRLPAVPSSSPPPPPQCLPRSRRPRTWRPAACVAAARVEPRRWGRAPGDPGRPPAADAVGRGGVCAWGLRSGRGRSPRPAACGPPPHSRGALLFPGRGPSGEAPRGQGPAASPPPRPGLRARRGGHDAEWPG